MNLTDLIAPAIFLSLLIAALVIINTILDR